jgi:hypothetical protein
VPERWLSEEGKSLQASFLAFSTGARGCIDRDISYLVQTVILDWEIKRLEEMNWLSGEMLVKVWRRRGRLA